MADKDTQLELKKRARRRLVGAAALALLAAVVLPLVMDQEPKPVSQDVQIRIPNQDVPSARLQPTTPAEATPAKAPEPAQTPPVQAAALPPVSVTSAPPTATPVTLAAVEKPVDKTVDKPQQKVDKPAKPVDKPAEKAKPVEKPLKPDAASDTSRAEAILNGVEPVAKADGAGGRYLLQIGVFSDAANVRRLREKIKGEGYNSQVEAVQSEKGAKSRVKAGPFASKDAAAKAQARLKRIGLDSVVVAKP